jgi:hypothetical protein
VKEIRGRLSPKDAPSSCSGASGDVLRGDRRGRSLSGCAEVACEIPGDPVSVAAPPVCSALLGDGSVDDEHRFEISVNGFGYCGVTGAGGAWRLAVCPLP